MQLEEIKIELRRKGRTFELSLPNFFQAAYPSRPVPASTGTLPGHVPYTLLPVPRALLHMHSAPGLISASISSTFWPAVANF